MREFASGAVHTPPPCSNELLMSWLLPIRAGRTFASISEVVCRIRADWCILVETTEFRRLLRRTDIMLLQESHLYVGQENVLQLPAGWSVLARSRASILPPRCPSGGVCALFRSRLPLQVIEKWSSETCLTLKLGKAYIFCVYLPPESSQFAHG
jgi:hypothetical protein